MGGAATTTGKQLLLPQGQSPAPGSEEAKIYALLADLLDPQSREGALLELSKKREMYEDLALVLWGGFGEFFFPQLLDGLLHKLDSVYLTRMHGDDRYHVFASTGNCLRLSSSQPSIIISTRQ
jgi:hypothetical protein